MRGFSSSASCNKYSFLYFSIAVAQAGTISGGIGGESSKEGTRTLSSFVEYVDPRAQRPFRVLQNRSGVNETAFTGERVAAMRTVFEKSFQRADTDR